MNLLKYQTAQDLVDATGWSVEEALKNVEAELKKLQKKKK